LGKFVDWTGALFRATAVARVAAKYPTRANELDAAAASVAASAVASVAANIAYSIDAYTPDCFADAAIAADAAARAVADADAAAARAADAAARTAASARAATDDADDAAAMWDAVGADATQAQAAGASALADAPLWPEETPGWAAEAWAALRSALPKVGDWEVWFDWCEERLRGGSRGEAYELVFATVPPEVWDGGAAAANAWIRAHLA
jgi:hypothetical protein